MDELNGTLAEKEKKKNLEIYTSADPAVTLICLLLLKRSFEAGRDVELGR